MNAVGGKSDLVKKVPGLLIRLKEGLSYLKEPVLQANCSLVTPFNESEPSSYPVNVYGC